MEGIEVAVLFIAKLLVIFKGRAYIFWDLKAACSLLERMEITKSRQDTLIDSTQTGPLVLKS